ncbi:ribonuclease hi [Plakobranchus ocellatus]|uniref:Ribonuclease hi n=1 Tax=Plakobranchus ocellatus TaxID=259542 RepID=A0AAV3ZAU3_9GAST|nr:ribonuclease hi [Plakobranchus ocellatus]
MNLREERWIETQRSPSCGGMGRKIKLRLCPQPELGLDYTAADTGVKVASRIGEAYHSSCRFLGLGLRVRMQQTSKLKEIVAAAAYFAWIPAHVSIQGNENVDKLAKAALNRAPCSGKLICWSDLKPKINAYIHSTWQTNWDAEGTNKLYDVLPNLGEDLCRRGEGAGRKRETVICRLRVGHTWLTQSYLLKNEEQPFCYACDSLYTVRHILIECPDFQVIRRKYFSVTDLYRLFREVNPSRIIGYLKELGVYRNI